MRFGLCAILALTIVSAAAPALAQQTPTVADQYNQLAGSTQLDRKGASPFHLKLETQLYDLQGKPSQTGAIEEWWVSQNEYRIEINSGSLHKVVATGEQGDSAEPATDRSSYLLDELLGETVHPLFGASPASAIVEVPRTFDKVKLSCFQLNRVPIAVPGSPELACSAAGGANLLLKVQDSEIVLRNSLGIFAGGVHVALKTSILYAGHTAISGKVTTLQPLASDTGGAPSLKPNVPAPDAGPKKPAVAHPGVMAGHLLKREQPIYPEVARMEHLQGTVLLHGVITKEGKVRSLFVIASPGELLSGAAMNAVRDWTYQPYLLNGQPTEVDTTIAVNFNVR